MAKAITCVQEFYLIGKEEAWPANGQYDLRCDIALKAKRAPLETLPGFRLNGNGHCISRAKKSVFASLDGAEIENLKVLCHIEAKAHAGALAPTALGSYFRNVSVEGTVSATGIAAGIVAGARLSRFDGCGVKACVTSLDAKQLLGAKQPAPARSGGICGHGASCGFAECSFEGTVESAGFAGGICGRAEDCEIASCRFAGEAFSSQALKSGGAGGICGAVSSSAIEAATASGDVYALCGPSGGIAGLVSGSSSISHCRTDGHSVISDEDAGGIAGRVRGDAASSITHCVSSSAYIFAQGRVGRILGVCEAGALLRLSANRANADMALSGDNTAAFGFAYHGDPAMEEDPEMGECGAMGESFAAGGIQMMQLTLQ